MAVAEVLERIQKHYAAMRQSEKDVADSFLNDPTPFARSSAFEIAVNAHVSEPTVARFCRAIGFTGLRDLRIALGE